jgi:hypothetical protein
MRSLSLLNSRALLLLIATSMSLIGVEPADAQPGAEMDTTDFMPRMAKITVKSRSVLRMGTHIRGVRFSEETIKSADPDTKEADVTPYIDSAEIWTQEAQTNQKIRSYSTVRAENSSQLEILINDQPFRSAIIKYHAERIYRIFNPPFDTLFTKNGKKYDPAFRTPALGGTDMPLGITLYM